MRRGAVIVIAMLSGAIAKAALAQGGPDGAALFGQHCAACHQPDGAGTVGVAPALMGYQWAKLGAERAYLPTVVVHGMAGLIKVNGQPFVGSMPAFGAQLDDATLAAIATHVRRLQGAADVQPYAAEEIKAARDKPGSPPQTRQLRVQLVGP
jgi:mono/diheme cytochrome c family protein